MNSGVIDASPRPPAALVGPLEVPVNPNSLRSYPKFTVEFERITSSASNCLSAAENNREIRRSYINVEALRREKKIAANATYVPVRIIDKNIENDMPQFVSYLTQAPRLVIMQPISGAYKAAGHPVDLIELEFTRVLKHEGWAEAYIRAIDGAQLNGWSWFEVVYDPDKPGRVRVDCVNFDELIYDVDVSCVQYSRIVARKYMCSRNRFDELSAQYNFNSDIVKLLRDDISAQSGPNSVPIFHVFFKEEGQVYSGWYVADKGKWLRDPSPFFNGVMEEELEPVFVPGAMEMQSRKVTKQAIETKYPYFVLQYRVTEERALGKSEGRATLDYSLQDAASSLNSALVNGCIQASSVMWAPREKDVDGGGTAPKQTEMVIRQNALWNTPMQSFTSPWPDPALFRSIEFLRSSNAADNSRPDFAVNNRKDSRKTATEIQAAAQQASLLSGTTLFIFSNTLRSVYTAAWRIVQSQAIHNGMQFCQRADGTPNVELIKEEFNILPAGDVDFVQRQERIAAMQQDIPLVANTPIMDVFIREYFRLRYPDMAERFNVAMDQQKTNDVALIQQLSTLLQAAAVDETGQLTPEFAPYAQQLQQLQATVAQRLGPAAGGGATPPAQGGVSGNGAR
jgi:hypothetical protein